MAARSGPGVSPGQVVPVRLPHWRPPSTHMKARMRVSYPWGENGLRSRRFRNTRTEPEYIPPGLRTRNSWSPPIRLLVVALQRLKPRRIDRPEGPRLDCRRQSCALPPPLVAPFQSLAELFGAVLFCAHRTSVRIDGTRGARWRRRSVSPSGGFTSAGSMYFFPSMSWAAYGSDAATCRIDAYFLREAESSALAVG